MTHILLTIDNGLTIVKTTESVYSSNIGLPAEAAEVFPAAAEARGSRRSMIFVVARVKKEENL